ncbi:MAG: DUF5677 domain-containing protein [Bacilli bacterium]|jgi:hypothetical protein|nr:DUF5677 domain-containing protein [Bacilli bacterium]
MSEVKNEHTQTDIELLKKLIFFSIQVFSRKQGIDPRTISAYTQSDLANSSRIIYSFLIKDCKTDPEKLAVCSDAKLVEYSNMIVEHYQTLVDYRYRSASKGMHVYSELSFALESTLTYMITLITPHAELNPMRTLLPDLFVKFFSQALGLLKMLNLDLASEAYSNWRTLHEAECVIKLLIEGGENVQNVYLRHLVYNNAFRHAIADVEETNQIFAEIKKNMASHGLKSKDMKKYIEYGWLYSCPTFHEQDPNYKLNFRNGLQKAAGLEDYNAWYEMASEMAHSSPIFFYSNNIFFADLTAVNLSDITIRAIGYFDKWAKINQTDWSKGDAFKEILMSNLRVQAKKEDDTFYTKYKDYLEDDNSEDDNSSSSDD